MIRNTFISATKKVVLRATKTLPATEKIALGAETAISAARFVIRATKAIVETYETRPGTGTSSS